MCARTPPSRQTSINNSFRGGSVNYFILGLYLGHNKPPSPSLQVLKCRARKLQSVASLRGGTGSLGHWGLFSSPHGLHKHWDTLCLVAARAIIHSCGCSDNPGISNRHTPWALGTILHLGRLYRVISFTIVTCAHTNAHVPTQTSHAFAHTHAHTRRKTGRMHTRIKYFLASDSPRTPG